MAKLDNSLITFENASQSNNATAKRKVGGQSLSHKDFVERIAKKHSTIKVLSEYVKNTVNVRCRCIKCLFEWDVLPSTLYDGKGCPKCSRTYRRNLQDLVTDLAKANPNIEIIGTEYKNMNTPIKCRCRSCKHIWMGRPTKLMLGNACPECSKKKMGEASRKTHEQFVAEIEELLPSVEIISKYEGWDKHVQCKCKACGNEWKVIPYYLRHSDGCPECVRKKNGSKVYSRKIDPEREKARRKKMAITQRKTH